MQKWEIEYYTKANGEAPVKAFIDNLPLKAKARTFKTLELLEDYGIRIGKPYVKKVEKELWELRVRVHEGTYRFFFTLQGRKIIVLLHAFQKKSQKIPGREMDIAIKRMREIK